MTNPATPAARRADLERLADLPGMIEQQERIILGLKADKTKVERRQELVEAKLRLSPEVKGESNEADRKASLTLMCEDHPDWRRAADRLLEVTATIRSHEAQRDLLRRERDGLNTRLMMEAALRMEAVLKDKDFRAAVGAGMLA